jgi:predicted ATPase/DNA-binding winged helix-turn-helix (wHTH) protein
VPEHDQRPLYGAGKWQADLVRRELRREGVLVPLGGRAFDVLEILVRAEGALVTTEAIMARAWPGLFVTPGTLRVHIAALRKAFGTERDMVATSTGQGYRLVGDWTLRHDITEVADLTARVPDVAPGNLPAAEAELIGRDESLRRVRDLLSAYRVVTLIGAGGIGKTRLALEVARQLRDSFQGDVWFVELAAIADPALIASAVARTLALDLGSTEPSDAAIVDTIGDRKLLLVLDNCEHVVDAAAALAETLVRLCPQTVVLATSREALRIDGEQAFRVPPLEVPPLEHRPSRAPHQTRPAARDHSAARLFIARVAAQQPDFRPTTETLPVIGAICRRLDGIPLAIEFAAARAATLGVQEVLGRLDDRLGLLVEGRRTALPRHRTLRATLDWSYQLLPETEQRLLRHLAVFVVGFTLDAAIAVMRDLDSDPSVMAGIANLVAKSLLVRDQAADRWRLLETTRAFAHEKLAENREAEAAARRHAVFFLRLVTPPAADAEPARDDLVRYGGEVDNVRSALDWAFSRAGDAAIGVSLTAVYVPVWLHLSLMAECRRRVEQALATDPSDRLDPRLIMQLHIALGVALTHTTGRAEQAGANLARALELADGLNDEDSQLRALWAIWDHHSNLREYAAAQPAAERFSRLAQTAENPGRSLVADRLMGHTHHYRGNQPQARLYTERVLDRHRVPQDRRPTIWLQYDQRILARAILARVLCLQGFPDQAKQQAQASFDEAQATDHKLSLCYALCIAIYPVALLTGDVATFEAILPTGTELAATHRLPYYRSWTRCLQGVLLIRRGQFAAGTISLRGALDDFGTIGARQPEFLLALAEGQAGAGRPDDALATIENAMIRADRQGENWCTAELHRVQGELLLQTGQPALAAAGCFTRALEIASGQGALLWELRAALSLARLYIRQREPAAASALLAPIHARFTEGFDTADLHAAKTLLAKLPAPLCR